MKLKKYSASEILALDPCDKWSRDDGAPVKKLCAAYPDGVDVLDVLLHPDVSDDEKLWAALRMVDPRVAVAFAADVADIALTAEIDAGRTPDKRSVAAVEAVHAYLRGEIGQQEIDSAANAAYYSANAAAIAELRDLLFALILDAYEVEP
jgi:hypothetical protein